MPRAAVSATLVVALVASAANLAIVDGFHFFSEPDATVTKANHQVLHWALDDAKNFAGSDAQRVCSLGLYSVKEFSTATSKDYFFQIRGCTVDVASATCPSACLAREFEVHVKTGLGPANGTAAGETVPFAVKSVGMLL